MIRRDSDDTPLLISQIEHARLAYDLARPWGNNQVAGLPLRQWLLPAIRDHDDGWFEWEQSPRRNADGVPLSFTEVSAADADAIWTRSIACCASGPPSSSEALRRLRAGDGEVSIEEALALETLLRGGRRFLKEALILEVERDAGTTEEIAMAAIDRCERQGLIRPCGMVLGREFHEINLEPVGEAPLGGLWVSGHFQALARQAMEHRAGEPGEREIVESFLDAQQRQSSEWCEAAAEFAGDEIERVVDSGLRYLQLFDRISLWLCMAERDEPWTARLSEERSFEFRPITRRIIQVAPWPFDEAALELEVSAFDGKQNVLLPWRLIPADGPETADGN